MGDLICEDIFLEKRIKHQLVTSLSSLNPDLSLEETTQMLLPKTKGNFNIIAYDYETNHVWSYAEYGSRSRALSESRLANNLRQKELEEYVREFGDDKSIKIVYFVFDSEGNYLR